MEAVPIHLEAAIYLYFLVVGAAGFLLYARLRFGRSESTDAGDGTSNAN
ncbi:hypothetical protein AB7C87_14465 [Natrarchaeobius sp. A-rgal3]